MSSKSGSFWRKALLLFSGIFLALAMLEAGMRITGSVILAVQEYRNFVSLRQGGESRILCIGESTTQNQYPRFLGPILNRRAGGKIKFSVIDKGMSATNSAAIMDRVPGYIEKYRPNIIIAMMGNNDGGETIPLDYPMDRRRARFFEKFSVYKAAKLLWFYTAKKFEGRGQKECLVTSNKPGRKNPVTGNPDPDTDVDADALIRLGGSYYSQRRFPEAEKYFKLATEKNPESSSAWAKLGTTYIGQQLYKEAGKCFEKAVDLNDLAVSQKRQSAESLSASYYHCYTGLGRVAVAGHDLRKAEEFYLKAIEVSPDKPDAYCHLGQISIKTGRVRELIKLCERYVNSPDPEEAYHVYGVLGVLHNEIGQKDRAAQYYAMAESDRLKGVYAKSVESYSRLKAIAGKENIRLVCVQYPMLSVGRLKKMFSSQDDGIIFVDNEMTFRDAVSAEGYNAYFIDMFGGEFGHCTDKGNRLLAQNIADAIAKIYRLPDNRTGAPKKEGI